METRHWGKREYLFGNLPLLALYIVLLSVPCCLKWEGDSFHFAKFWLVSGFVSSLPIAIVLYLASGWSRWVKYPVCTILWILFIIEFFVFAHFHCRVNDRVVFLILQTDSREGSEFLTSYLPQWQSLIPAGAAITVAAAYLMVRKSKSAMRRFIIKREKSAAICLAGAFLAGTALDAACIFSHWVYTRVAKPTAVQLWESCHAVWSYRTDITRLEQSVGKSDGHVSLPLDSLPDIVFVIGESFNPHHSPLYGYPLPTTPRMQALVDSGMAVVFHDAVSPSAATAKMTEILFSPAPLEEEYWNYPLIPTLFRTAGYHVALHDNQTTRVAADIGWDAGNCHFLNSDVVSDASFDYRNTRLHSFDLDFALEETDSMKKSIQKPRLDIFHLMGQHKPADKRMPKDWKTVDFDYSYRSELTPSQTRDLNSYDNATLYNDSVMSVILNAVKDRNAVVVYVSDHGEEVHDYRDQYGRTLEPISKGMAHNVYEVPLLVFFTPEYEHRNPGMRQTLYDAARKKVFTADIGQLLLSLGRISTGYYDAARDPLSPSYSSEGRRILNFEKNYDAL